MNSATNPGDKIVCVLQVKVDTKRSIWLCARDKHNSGNPVYVQGVPASAKAGDVITGIVADDKGTVFYDKGESE